MGRDAGGYRQPSIPVELADAIDDRIKTHPELGFRTLSEFVRHAAIEQLRLLDLHLALKAIWATTELGADAVDALLRDSLPRDYRAILDSERRRHPRE